MGYIPFTPEHQNICSIGRPLDVDLSKVLPNKTVVIVAAPGAFTPTCTERHIPGFVSGYKQLKDSGVDEVYVLTTDNPFVQAAWGKALGNKGEVKFVSDPKGAFSAKLGLATLLNSDLLVKVLDKVGINDEQKKKLSSSLSEIGYTYSESHDDFVPVRTYRYAAVIVDGVVKYIGVEHNGSLDRSTFPSVLRYLESAKL